MTRTFTAGAIALVAVSCSQPKPAPTPPKSPFGPSCVVETTLQSALAPESRTFPPNYWYTLLLRGYRASGGVPRPIRDCAGFPIAWNGDRCAVDPKPTVLPERPLAADDLFLFPREGGKRLAWVITDRLSTGLAEGPVAFVDLEAQGMVVHALGTLRAFATRPRLRLETLGDTVVLVAEGDSCTESRSDCERALRVMPVRRDRFVDGDLEDERGQCVGRSLFLLRTNGQTGTGAARASYRFESSVTFAGDAILVREQLAIERSVETGGDGFVRKVQGERKVKVKDGRLLVDAPSLLERWIKQSGE